MTQVSKRCPEIHTPRRHLLLRSPSPGALPPPKTAHERRCPDHTPGRCSSVAHPTSTDNTFPSTKGWEGRLSFQQAGSLVPAAGRKGGAIGAECHTGHPIAVALECLQQLPTCGPRSIDRKADEVIPTSYLMMSRDILHLTYTLGIFLLMHCQMTRAFVSNPTAATNKCVSIRVLGLLGDPLRIIRASSSMHSR